MRTIMVSLAPVLFSVTLSAQGVFSNKTQSILEKVIQDYPNHFYNIKGELIGHSHQATTYRSTLQLPGSGSTVITCNGESHATGYDWTCVVFAADNFQQATARFKEIYDQIGNSIITTSHGKTFILSGQFERPDPEKKYNIIEFNLLPGVVEVKKLKVDLYMIRESETKWTIFLSVNDQDLKNSIQGEITSN